MTAAMYNHVKDAAIVFKENFIPDTRDALYSIADSTKVAATHVGDAGANWTANFVKTLTEGESTLFSVKEILGDVGLAARGIREIMATLYITLFVIAFSVIAYLLANYRRLRRIEDREINQQYLREHYGDNIEMKSRVYLNLMQLHADRIQRSSVGAGTKETKVILVGANEEVESCIRQKSSSLIFPDDHFVFSSITDAMKAAEDYCQSSFSEPKQPQTLFIFLLISARDPSVFGPQLHKPFTVSTTIANQGYAIIGTGSNVVHAHKLSRSSKGPEGECLADSLPMGAQESRVSF